MVRTSILVIFMFTLALLLELCAAETDSFDNEENEGIDVSFGPSHAILTEQPLNITQIIPITTKDEPYNVEAAMEKREEAVEDMMPAEGTTKKARVDEEEIEPVEVVTVMNANQKAGVSLQEEEEEEQEQEEQEAEEVARVVTTTEADQSAEEVEHEEAGVVKDIEHYDINPKLKLPFNARGKKPHNSRSKGGNCSSCPAIARKVGMCHC